MKKIIKIEPISRFTYRTDFKVRTEIEYYSDGTSAIAEAMYKRKYSN